MLRAAILSLAAGAAAAEGVPSGQPLALWEVRWERVEGTEDEVQMVLRLVAPELGAPGGADYDAAVADMDWLCETHARPLAALAYAQGDQVVITLMDRPVPRGATDPEAVQFFQTYRLGEDGCAADELR